MKSFIIKYTEAGESHSAYLRAYDTDHAWEKFVASWADQGGMAGIEILSIKENRPKIEKPILDTFNNLGRARI